MISSEGVWRAVCLKVNRHDSFLHAENEVAVFECYPLAPDNSGVALGLYFGRRVDRGEVESLEVGPALDRARLLVHENAFGHEGVGIRLRRLEVVAENILGEVNQNAQVVVPHTALKLDGIGL